MEVLCINADKLPPGAEIKEGNTYSVLSEFNNNFDQKVYIIKGVTNEGRTKFGLPWIGYRADRFVSLTEQTISVKERKQEPILN
jgi:hypothetical protein